MQPRRFGLFAPTRDYVDTSRWPEVVIGTEGAIVQVWHRLLAKEYDAARVHLEYVDQYPDEVVVDELIGSPDDAWLVFGRIRASKGGLVVHHDSVVGRDIGAM